MAAVGCGGKKTEDAASPAGMDTASGEVTDAKSLAREMQNIISGGRDFKVSSSADINGTLTISTGSFPMEISLHYSTDVLNSGEANEDLSISGGLDGGYNSLGWGSSVLLEGGEPFSYVVNENLDKVKMKGDCLEDTRYVSSIFQSIADGSVEVEYSESAGKHYMTFEADGDVLRDLLAQYCYPLVWGTDDFDWNSVAADVQIELAMDNNIGPFGTISLESPDLIEALIMTTGSVEAVEGMELALEIRYSFGDIKNMESWSVDTSAPEVEGELPKRQGVIDLVQMEVFDKINQVNAENFEEIETTDPITLTFGDIAVTMTFPAEIPYYKTFNQDSPNSTYLLRSGFGNLNTVELDMTNPNTFFNRARKYYSDSIETDSQFENISISDVYTLETSLGQAEVLHYDYEFTQDPDMLVHTVHYYGVLPLGKGVYLFMDVDNSYDTQEEGVHLDDGMMKALFDHCGIGDETPAIADARYGSLEEYLEVPENWEKCEALADDIVGDQSMGAEVAVEENRLIYTFTIPNPGAGREINIQATADQLSLTFMRNQSYLEGYAAEISRGVSVENPTIVIIFNTFDGQEVFSEEYSAN